MFFLKESMGLYVLCEETEKQQTSIVDFKMVAILFSLGTGTSAIATAVHRWKIYYCFYVELVG